MPNSVVVICDIQNARSTLSFGQSNKIIKDVRWQAPPESFFKLNTDGSRLKNGLASAGGLVRDCSGNWQNIALFSDYGRTMGSFSRSSPCLGSRYLFTWLQRWIANMTLNLFLPQDWCLMPIFSNHCIKELTNTEWQITIKWYMWPNLRIKLEVILLILRPNLQVPYLSAFTIYVLDYW